MIKFRYQNKNFKNSLDKARHFKRHAKKLPEAESEIFFAHLGLDSWPSRLALVFILGALIYLSYVPNFLYVKNIEISGLKQADRQLALKTSEDYLHARQILPQQNLFFLNSGKLKQTLEKSSLHIRSAKIQKKYFSGLSVEITGRYNSFYTQKQGVTYAVSPDGLVMEAGGEISTSTLLRLDFARTGDWAVGQKILSDDEIRIISLALKQIPSTINQKIIAFQIHPEQDQDIGIVPQNGYLLKIDLKSQWDGNIKNLEALLAQIPPSTPLAYIDLRVPERAYVCYKGAACASTQPFKPQSVLGATSTQETITKP